MVFSKKADKQKTALESLFIKKEKNSAELSVSYCDTKFL